MTRPQLFVPGFIILASLVLIAAFPVASEAMLYAITIENQIPGGPDAGQPLSQSVVIIHDGGYRLFGPGETATPGFEILAEEGLPEALINEALANPHVMAAMVGAGPIWNHETIEIEGNPGELLSVAMMLGRSNDLVTGIHDVILPPAGELIFNNTDVFDGGTEANTGMIEDIPFYGHYFTGQDDRAGMVTVPTYTVYNDPEQGQIEWQFPPSSRITVTALGAVPVLSTTWGRVRTLFR